MICGLALLPIQNPGYAYALNHVQYAYHIPVVASEYCRRTFTSGCLQNCKGAKQQNIRCIASILKFLWYGSMEWNMEENFSMEWNMEENFSMEWKILGMEMEIEWKKIASMEYEKIVFHAIPYRALTVILLACPTLSPMCAINASIFL